MPMFTRPNSPGSGVGAVRSPLTIENLLEAHENAGIDLCVVSNTIHYLKEKTNDESLAFLRRWNDYGPKFSRNIKIESLFLPALCPAAARLLSKSSSAQLSISAFMEC